MHFWACPPGSHFASGDAFLGVPGVGGISLRGMRFWACPVWEASRFGACVSGRARCGRHFASGDAFLGVPGVRCISLRGMGFWACPVWEASRFGACVSGRARRGVISLRGMHFWACPAWEAFRFGACVSGRARWGMHSIERKLRLNGDNRNWDSIKSILKTHCRVTLEFIVSENGELLKNSMRTNSRPEKSHLDIYRKL